MSKHKISKSLAAVEALQAIDTGASVGAASAADATATLQIGRRSGNADFLAGAIHGLILRVGAVSDSACLQWLAYEKAWLGL
jgi:hypothetical protein